MAGEFRAGAAAVNITPPLGLDMSGFIARLGPAESVRDPLSVRAVALEKGEARALLLVADVLGFTEEQVEEVRRSVQERTGWPGACVLLAGTHTHSGPAVVPLRWCGIPDPGYVGYLMRQCVSAAEMAVRRLEPAQILLGSGQATFNWNRRGEGVVDPTVSVLAWGQERRWRGILFAYGCHPVVLGAWNQAFSADYPGGARRTVETHDPEAVAVFFNACAGDVNPRPDAPQDVDPSQRWRGREEKVEQLGRWLGFEVLRVLEMVEPQEVQRLRVGSRRVKIPLRLPGAERIEEIRTRFQPWSERTPGSDEEQVRWRIAQAMMEWVREAKEALERGIVPQEREVEIWALALNESAWVALPAEVFTAIGLQIRQASPFPLTTTLGYANGLLGYLPTDAAIERGGYEVDDAIRYYGLVGPAPGSEGLVVEGALTLLQALA